MENYLEQNRFASMKCSPNFKSIHRLASFVFLLQKKTFLIFCDTSPNNMITKRTYMCTVRV